MSSRFPLQPCMILLCLSLIPAPSFAMFAHPGTPMDMSSCLPMEDTGHPDADFMTNMIPHHQMAVDMAKKVLKEGKDPEVRQLAEDIIKAQDAEIKQMQAWLDRNSPRK